MSRSVYCVRSNTDRCALEMVDLAFLEESDELFDLLVGLSDIC